MLRRSTSLHIARPQPLLTGRRAAVSLHNLPIRRGAAANAGAAGANAAAFAAAAGKARCAAAGTQPAAAGSCSSRGCWRATA